MKYYLMWDEASNRMIIDGCKRSGWVVEKETTATSWIEAKKKFGFELTPLQQEMLNEKNNRTEAGGGIVRHQQNAGTQLWPADSKLFDRLEALEDSGECV